MSYHAIKLTTGTAEHAAKLTLDGVEVRGVTNVHLELSAERMGVVSLVVRIIPSQLEIEGQADVRRLPLGFAERIDAALERLKSGQGLMRIPADPTDPDVVLSDLRAALKAAAE